mmetsp:Transcript_15838/g.22941  ORF Transcript_15838/g.22941 Transcript_15838/m.22941 type:complete len:397 (+) Transcript_15838:18-1208(+)
MQGEYDKTRWFDMLKSGSIEEIKSELEQHPKHFLLNLTDNSQSRHTCIFYAVQSDDVNRGNQLLETLLREGADPNFKDLLSQTCLFYASRYGRDEQIQMLCNAGAEVNHKDTYGQTPLYYGSREGNTSSCRLLLQKGADVNTVDNLGQTAIFYACREGRFETSKLLVEYGANLNKTDRTRNTPLTWARRSNIQELVDFLLSKGAIDRVANKKKETNGKRKEEKKKSEKKTKCQLMIVDEKGDKRPATEQELADFEKDYPDIAKYWKNPETLSELDSMSIEEIDNLKPWEKPGKKLMSTLSRNSNSWIFQEPVDPVKLNIPDYFDIVKEPMDFGTIKKKLNNNVYSSGQEFIRDMELVFHNCRLYNPPDSDVITMCSNVQNLYEKQLKELGLDKYKA